MNKHIIFDFGAVLIDWNPDQVYLPYFKDSEAMNKFYQETEIHILNKEFDRGVPHDHGLKPLAEQFPHYHEPIHLWKTAWHKMIIGPIDGSIAILRALHTQGYPLYGLTNWAAETFPYVYYNYDFFQCFQDIVVSGREKVIKPDTQIYEILLRRNNLNPKQCVFIDDNADNVAAAEALGMKGICFLHPEQLSQALKTLDIVF
jgi:2-haloacid dehalogenase